MDLLSLLRKKPKRVTQQDRIEAKLDIVIARTEEIRRMDAETQALLTKIDTTTNSIAANIETIAAVDKTISDELTNLLVQQTDPALKSTLQGFADRLQATADASTAQVEVLKGIAAKGAPVVPPAPVTPPVA